MSDRMEDFERSVIFRVARVFFFCCAVGAVLTFLGGGALLIRGMIEEEIPAPVLTAPPSEPVHLSYENLIAAIEQERATQKKEGGDKTPAAAAGDPDKSTKEEDRRAVKLNRDLHEVFPAPLYAWNDVVETYCATPSDFGCLSRGERISKHGVIETIDRALKGIAMEDAMPILEAMVSVIGQAPLEGRDQLIAPYIRMELRARERARVDREAYDRAVSEQRVAHERALEASAEKRSGARMVGVYAMAGGFGFLVLLSLFLAFLAIERHLRPWKQVAVDAP